MKAIAKNYYYEDNFGKCFITIYSLQSVREYGKGYFLLSIVISNSEMVVNDHIVFYCLDDLFELPFHFFKTKMIKAREHVYFGHYFRLLNEDILKEKTIVEDKK